LHLVTSVEKVVENNLPFTFSNGHAEMATAEFYEATEDLTRIDWDVMKSEWWNDTDNDPNRKWKRQAEFLVYNSFPISLLGEIGVISQRVASEVQQILAAAGCPARVIVRQDWYYS
jgi:hypothetical protein